MSFVYFIECMGRIKIGFALDVRERLIDLQNAAPRKLKLLGKIAGDKFVERSIHHKLADHRSHGEWFFAVPEVRNAVKQYLAAGAIVEPPLVNRRKVPRQRLDYTNFARPNPWVDAIRSANRLLERYEEAILAAPPSKRRLLFDIFYLAVDELDQIISAEPLMNESAAPIWLANFEKKLTEARTQ